MTTLTTLQAQLSLPAAFVQVWHFDLPAAGQHVLRQDQSYRLDLSLSPRLPGTGLCFADHWAAHRYERAGRLFVLPPGQTMHVRSGIGQQDAIVCRLPVDRLAGWLDQDLAWTNRRLEASLDIGSGPITNLLLQLGKEARNPGFATDVLSEALAVQIAVQLERFYRGIADAPSSVAGGLAPWRLRLIDARLRDLPAAPSLSELASLCRLSVRQLSRGYRASRGVSIGDHVARERIAHAKHLLATAPSVKAVAAAMGFASSSSFGFAFRKATGLSPADYRARR